MSPIEIGTTTNRLRDTIVGWRAAWFEVGVRLKKNEAEGMVRGFAKNMTKPPQLCTKNEFGKTIRGAASADCLV